MPVLQSPLNPQLLQLGGFEVRYNNVVLIYQYLACGEMTHGWSLVRGQPKLGFAKLHASVQGIRTSLCGIPTVFRSTGFI